MRKFYISVFLMALLFPGLATSQTFEIVSSNIVDGSTEVALESEIRFTFNQPLDQEYMSYHLEDVILINHDIDLWEYISFSENGEEMIFTMMLESDTDYQWIILGAVSESGEKLADPFLLRFTTAANLGPHTISGQVVYESTTEKSVSNQTSVLQTSAPIDLQQQRLNRRDIDLSSFMSKDLHASQQSGLDQLHKLMEQNLNSVIRSTRLQSGLARGLKSQFYSSRLKGSAIEIPSVQNEDSEEVYYTLVILANRPYEWLFEDIVDDGDDGEYNDEYDDSVQQTEEENGFPVVWAAIANPEDGSFSIPYVRDGTYYLMVLEIPVYGEEFFFSGFGYYEDEGGEQALEVTSDISGLEITVSTFQSIRAQAAIQEVKSYLAEREITAEVKYVMCFELEFSTEPEDLGNCEFWMVILNDPDGGEEGNGEVYMAAVMPAPLGVLELFPMDEEDLEGIDLTVMLSIPDEIADSDIAVTVAENNGGSEFRANLSDQSNEMLFVSIEGGHNYWEYPFTDGNANPGEVPLYWKISYYSMIYNETEENYEYSELSIYVDMVTGELIGEVVSVDDEDVTQIPLSVRLDQNYPNPFNPSTTIPFQITEKGMVRLTVYDMLGRTVAVLVDGEFPAGQHQVAFQADHLPSGLYLYQLDAGNHTEIRKMLLIK